MKPRHLALLGAVLALAGCTTANTADTSTGGSTMMSTQGSSTATITQSGGGSTMTRRTVDGPDGQTIIQSQGGNRAVVTQSSRGSMARSSPRLDRDTSEGLQDDIGGAQITVSMTPEEQEALQELARASDTTVQALVEEAIQDFLNRTR